MGDYRVYVLAKREPVITDDKNRLVNVRTGFAEGEYLALYHRKQAVFISKLFPRGASVVIVPHFSSSQKEIYRVGCSQDITAQQFERVRKTYMRHGSDKQLYEKELDRAYNGLAGVVRRARQMERPEIKKQIAEAARRIRQVECLKGPQQVCTLEVAIQIVLGI